MHGSPFNALKQVPAVLLVAGHGGKDCGATNGSHNERDQVIYITDRISKSLEAILPHGSCIVAPHGQDTHESIAWANRRYDWGDVWALEIHRDSFPPTTPEPDRSLRCGCYYGTSTQSRLIAEYVASAMKIAGAHSSTWARPDTVSGHSRLGWIRQPEALSHLIELGAMEGRNDQAHLDNLASIATAAILSAFAGRVSL